ncbi:hypothetical protein [Pimelobacter simplex]|uniref:hypothetical protein n=1 Tax=Nocardioides simplex TaxID=2045 RepID=UPI0019331570|nr:hypothetical protein [Pimelobacter simplex]
MRRLVSAGVVAVASIALATPALTSTAAATPGTADVSTAAVAAKVKANKFKIKKSADGVQPGISKLVLTAKGLKGSGKVKFKIDGAAGTVYKKKAKVKKGKAKLLVPALGTGQYKVKASFKGRKGKTKFEVYDSNLTLNTTTVVCDRSGSQYSTRVSGSVKYKGGPATSGYVDVYQNGNAAGGSSSPYLLGFASVNSATGTFDFGTGFCSRIINGGTGSALRSGLPNGAYVFQAYYTKDAGYDDYFSSNFINVTVQD